MRQPALIDYYAVHATEADLAFVGGGTAKTLAERCHARLAFGDAMVLATRGEPTNATISDSEAQTLEFPIEALHLGVRARNGVRSTGCKTLGDLVKITEEQLLALRSFGSYSLREVKIALRRYGLGLTTYGE